MMKVNMMLMTLRSIVALVVLVFTLGDLGYAATEITDKKEAQQWVGFSLSERKKMLTAAKKVKKEKDVAAFNQAVNKVYKEVNSYPGVDPMGQCRPGAAPYGAACDEAFAKKERQDEVLSSEIDRELERLKALNIPSDAMQEALFKLKMLAEFLGS